MPPAAPIAPSENDAVVVVTAATLSGAAGGAPPPLPRAQPPPYRVVNISLNIISVVKVDLSFTANVLVHVEWNPRPTPAEEMAERKWWRPWIQFHNAVHLQELPNLACLALDGAELERLVRVGQLAKESRNYIGRFSCPFQLRHYPFDVQQLCVVIVTNAFEDIVLGTAPAKIKCNNEGEFMQEWEVVPSHGGVAARRKPLWQRIAHASEVRGTVGRLCGAPPAGDSFEPWCFSIEHSAGPGLSAYRVFEQPAALSGANKTYMRLELFVAVRRQTDAVLWAVLAPTYVLSLSSLSVFGLGLDDSYGERLEVLFVVILAIIANLFLIKERLPHLPFLTVLDRYMYALQGFVYAIVVETTVLPVVVCGFPLSSRDPVTYACESDGTPASTLAEVDAWVAVGMLAAFGGITLAIAASTAIRVCERERIVGKLKMEADLSKEQKGVWANMHPEKSTVVSGGSGTPAAPGA